MMIKKWNSTVNTYSTLLHLQTAIGEAHGYALYAAHQEKAYTFMTHHAKRNLMGTAKSIDSGQPVQSEHVQNFLILADFLFINPYPNNPWFLCVCSRCRLKTPWEKEKLLIMSNFSFFHSVFYLLEELSAVFIKLEIVVCKYFQFGRFENFVIWERVE